MRYSILTESEKRKELAWVYHCPKCSPRKVMNIESVFPMAICNSSIVTYACERCGYKDDLLIN